MRRVAFAIIAMIATNAWCSDAWFLRFQTVPGKRIGCRQAIWSSETLLFNQNQFPVLLRLLDISNGPLIPGAETSLTLQPKQVITLEGSVKWYPISSDQPWVLHVDVPDGVIIESRNVVEDDENCTPEHVGSKGAVAKVSMPVVRRLSPANVPQVILGTDMVMVTGTRQNVTIFNAGDIPATATIEVRHGCNDALADARTVTIPPHSVKQFGGLTGGVDTLCPFQSRTFPWVLYTVVTVDQPSFVLISTLRESGPVTPDGVTPLVELAMTFSPQF